MTYKILVSAPYIQPVIDEYRHLLEGFDPDIEIIVPTVRERLSQDELMTYIQDIDGVICGDDEFTELVMDSAPKLKVISKWGTGIDSIDQEAAKRHGIAICNTPDAFSSPVADSVLGYMLCFARRIPWMDRDIREGLWRKPTGFSLRESTLGVIGLGNVGKAVVRRAKAFGMTLIGNDIVSIAPDFILETGLELVDQEEIFLRSDFVSLNCELNSANRHMVGEVQLRKMKTTAFLINAARGPLVDEQALINALRRDEIAGAGLDVFEVEPLPHDSGLLQLDNCLVAPHNSNSSPEAYQRVHENTINNLLAQLGEKSI